jgi:uncharacterized protein (DUF1800 family)
MKPNPRTAQPKPKMSTTFLRSPVSVLLAAAALAACGGGGGSDSSTATAQATTETGGVAGILSAARQAVSLTPVTASKMPAPADAAPAAAAPDRPASRLDALRFMTNATFGPVVGDEEVLKAYGYSGWLERQFALPMSAQSHRAYWEAADAAIKAVDPNSGAYHDEVFQSFWKQALTSPDQLRQRVAFALTQIFVISLVDSNVGNNPRAVAHYLDMMGQYAFGNYRDLLQAVSLHPQMGRYLSHLANQKANNSTGRVPDENYAREVMQLLSIGVLRLNPDGTPMSPAQETYGPADVSGLARVFTGFSYACPGAPTNNNCFFNGSTGGSNSQSDPDREFKPMVAYPQFHSQEAKNFLGVTIPVQTTANPTASLQVALDTLFNHPNVGPFIGKQLIQRLVTSNPSPAYVLAVAQAFNNNGAGVRGDMKAVLRAIYLHPESRQMNNSAGKVREPILRLSAYLRAFPHTSDTGAFRINNTDNATNSLGQTVLRSGSVFNFFRPGYSAPGSQSAAAGLVAPEMQILNETSASGWANYMRDNVSNGVGATNGTVNGVPLNRRDLQRDWSLELELTTKPDRLAQRVADKLLYGQASPALQAEIVTAVSAITIPTSGASAIATARRNRLNAALLITLASPDFQVQK